MVHLFVCLLVFTWLGGIWLLEKEYQEKGKAGEAGSGAGKAYFVLLAGAIGCVLEVGSIVNYLLPELHYLLVALAALPLGISIAFYVTARWIQFVQRPYKNSSR
ncbi:MAG TPA: hypothetical protein VEA59_03040 [Patescibacteria group bacterium]|nr:hypothetical protein [Patescibacteria group bacterium]